MSAEQSQLRNVVLKCFSGPLLFFILLIMFVWFKGPYSFDPGLGWHLKLGQLISESFEVPRLDPFLDNPEPRLFIANQWIADVVFYQLLMLCGWGSLHLLVVFSGLLAFFAAIEQALARLNTAAVAGLVVQLAVFAAAAPFFVLRPVMFGYLFFAATWLIARRYITSAAVRYMPLTCGMAVLFALWANVHPSFHLGIAVLAAAALCRCVPGRSGIELLKALSLCLLCFLATLVNPHGLDLHASIFGLVLDPFFMNLNMEWHAPNLKKRIFFPFFVLIAALLVLGLISFRRFKKSSLKPVYLFDCALVLVFLAAALNHRRFIPFFCIVAAPPLAAMLELRIKALLHRHPSFGWIVAARFKPAGLRLACCTMAALFLLAALSRGIPGRTDRDLSIDRFFPHSAVKYIKDNPGEGRIFHTPNWGGYMTYMLWPGVKASIDDRNELNGVEAYKNYLLVDRLESGWQQRLEQGMFSRAIIAADSKLAQALQDLPDWEKEYQDDKAVILSRR